MLTQLRPCLRSEGKEHGGAGITASEPGSVTTAATANSSWAQEEQPRKRMPPPAPEALRFEAEMDGAPGEKEAGQALIAHFQQHGSVLECSFNLLPCPAGKVCSLPPPCLLVMLRTDMLDQHMAHVPACRWCMLKDACMHIHIVQPIQVQGCKILIPTSASCVLAC